MKMIKTAFAVALTCLLAFTSGCLSSTYHLGGENDYPYNGTVDCWSHCICVWERESKDKLENAMDAYTKMVYPFWIVDFPLEIVSDTLWLPFDAIVELAGD